MSTSYISQVVAKSKLRSVRDKERIRLELLGMTQIAPSPFVTRCYMAFESVTNVFFVTDLLRGGDLFYHLLNRIEQTGAGFSEDEARILLSEIAVGIQHLHNHGFTHGDIKVHRLMEHSWGLFFFLYFIQLSFAHRSDVKYSFLYVNVIH
jgi:serine/threonine protein kinase